jgi:putative transposase
MKYHPHNHHRASIRLKGYDYSSPGGYFLTICTHNRECLFGKITDGKMMLNAIGEIAYNEWTRTAEMRENVTLDLCVIMPNHIHGIIILGCRGTEHRAPTIEQFGKPTSNTIPTIVRSYKATVTNQINIVRHTPYIPVWQRNYYEHIIRADEPLNQIRQYIIENPSCWDKDELNPRRITAGSETGRTM